MNERFEVGDDDFLIIEGQQYQKIDEGSDSFVYINIQTKEVLKIYHSLSVQQLNQYYFLMKEFENFLYEKYISGELKTQIKVRNPKIFGPKKINNQFWLVSESDFIEGRNFENIYEKEYIELYHQIEKYLGEFLGKKIYHLHKRNIKIQNGEITLVDIGNQIPKFLAEYEKSKNINFRLGLKQILGL